MTWALHWSATAVRGLARLDAASAKRIVQKLDGILADPPRHVERLRGSEERKLRVGDWRVILLLDFERKQVFVVRVGHRSNVYRQ